MAEFDQGFKMVAESAGRQLARLAGVEAADWEPAESTVQATVERLADRVFLAGRGKKRFAVYFEFYTAWDLNAPWDMLVKSSLISQRERLPTVTIAVVLRRKGFRSRGGQLRLEAAGGPTQQLWYKEVCLWALKPEAWWEDEPGLMALYPLCDHGKAPKEAVAHAADKIETKVARSSEQGTYLALLGIFGKLAYRGLDVTRLIGEEKMKDSLFYQEILHKGELAGQRAAVLRVLRSRFLADPPADIIRAVSAVDDAAAIESLLDLVGTCADLAAFRAALRPLTTGA